MSFQVNGTKIQVLNASDYATQILDNTNVLLTNSGLTALVPTNTNAIWWSMQGSGSIAQSFFEALQSASSSFNPASADDQQIVNLLPIMGTELLPATPTTMILGASNVTGSSITIPTGTLFTSSYGTLQTTYNVIVPASSSVNFVITAISTGPWSIPAGSLIVPVVSGITFTQINNSVPGVNAETPSQARSRILQRSSLIAQIDTLIDALRGLTGITTATAWFNQSTATSLTIGSITIPPRQLYVVVQGYSPYIASTILAYNTAETYNSGTVYTNTQTYTTLGGQTLTCYYDSAQTQYVYIRVHIASAYTQVTGYQQQIYNIVSSLNVNLSFKLGKIVTSEMSSSQFSSFTNAVVTGIDLSLDGSTWSMSVQPNPYAMPTFIGNNIYTIILVE